MVMQASWHGRHQEFLEVVNAVANHRACQLDEPGEPRTVCGPHRMLASDQRALDGLLFVRRMAERLTREEFSVARHPTRV